MAKGKIALHFIEKQRVLKNALLSRVLVEKLASFHQSARVNFTQMGPILAWASLYFQAI